MDIVGLRKLWNGLSRADRWEVVQTELRALSEAVQEDRADRAVIRRTLAEQGEALNDLARTMAHLGAQAISQSQALGQMLAQNSADLGVQSVLQSRVLQEARAEQGPALEMLAQTAVENAAQLGAQVVSQSQALGQMLAQNAADLGAQLALQSHVLAESRAEQNALAAVVRTTAQMTAQNAADLGAQIVLQSQAIAQARAEQNSLSETLAQHGAALDAMAPMIAHNAAVLGSHILFQPQRIGTAQTEGHALSAKRVALFQSELAAASATMVEVESPADVPDAIARFVEAHEIPARVIPAEDHRLLSMPWTRTALQFASGHDEIAPRPAVSHAFGAAAKLGALVVIADPKQAPHYDGSAETHIIVVEVHQLEDNVNPILRRLCGGAENIGIPTGAILITGPSRSDDLDGISSLGLHRPKRLHVILISRGAAAVSSRVRELIESGNFARAEEECHAALAYREDAGLLAALGHVAAQTGQHDRAVVAFRRASLIGGAERWMDRFVLGSSLRALGEHEEARLAFAHVHKLQPQHLEAAIALVGETAAARGFIAARELYASLSAEIDSPDLSRAWVRLAFEHGQDPALDQGPLIACSQRSALEWAKSGDGEIRWIGDVEEIPVKTPLTLGIEHEPFEATVMSNRPYVATLRAVEIFSRSNIILTQDRTALNEIAAHDRYGAFVSQTSDPVISAQRPGTVLIDRSGLEMRLIERGAMLSGVASNAFGHWVPEYLPRLEYFEQHPEFADFPLIVDEDMPRSHFEWLTAITTNPVVKLPSGVGFRCEELLFAPAPTFYPVHLVPDHAIPQFEIAPLSPRALRYLRERVTARVGQGPPASGRYYLSRRRTIWRQLENESEVAAFLEREGFEIVDPEDLSFADQIRLFQRAETIVAPNGSSLLNLIFARPSIRVLVLSSANLFNWSGFYGPMRALGFEPVFVCGQAGRSPEQKHGNYTVPLDLLKTALAGGA